MGIRDCAKKECQEEASVDEDLTGGMGIRDCAKKECQEEASVDEDLLDKNLMSVASSSSVIL